MSLSSSTRPSSSGRGSGGSPVGGGSRLPSSRERRPALAALAVILILLGAAGSALITLRSGQRQDFVAISAEALEPGHKIERKDLARGDLAGSTGGLVLWADVEDVVNHYTTTWLYKDQFLTKGHFTKGTKPEVPAGGALVGVSLEGGRAPSDTVSPGDIVRVIRVPAANADGGVPVVLVGAAEVTSSSGGITDSRTNANSTLNVTVLVPTEKSTVVAAAAAAKTLVLVKLSSATKPEISANSGER